MATVRVVARAMVKVRVVARAMATVRLGLGLWPQSGWV